jgi:hypothetical protein
VKGGRGDSTPYVYLCSLLFSSSSSSSLFFFSFLRCISVQNRCNHLSKIMVRFDREGNWKYFVVYGSELRFESASEIGAVALGRGIKCNIHKHI